MSPDANELAGSAGKGSAGADSAGADSAGQPWAGRTFEPNPAAGDDGSADPALLAALSRFASGEAPEADVVDAVRTARLLVPLVAHLGEAGENDRGVLVDKTQELAIVTVAGPDGRTVLPAFTSVDAMRSWNPLARPIPVDGVRVAQAAVSEGTELVVIDPVSETEFAIRRPALLAIANGAQWAAAYLDDEVAAQVVAAVADEPAVTEIALMPGDPHARLAGPELEVRVSITPGLDEADLAALLGRIQANWGESTIIAERVDSLSLRVVAAV
jgi:hypothetical protein